MVHVGILSDTHIGKLTEPFIQQVKQSFQTCHAIIHAGDLTDVSILDEFEDKDLYCVCGNMCNQTTQQQLPTERLVEIQGKRIGITHGHTIYPLNEGELIARFPTADCIVFGHTHQPFCQHIAEILFINPGTFRPTSPYGSPGTYAILEIDKNGMKASIHQLPLLS